MKSFARATVVTLFILLIALAGSFLGNLMTATFGQGPALVIGIVIVFAVELGLARQREGSGK